MPRKNYSHKPPKPSLMPVAPHGDKRRYASEAEATQVKTEQELLNPGLTLKVYKCTAPGCGGWHLTRRV